MKGMITTIAFSISAFAFTQTHAAENSTTPCPSIHEEKTEKKNYDPPKPKPQDAPEDVEKQIHNNWDVNKSEPTPEYNSERFGEDRNQGPASSPSDDSRDPRNDQDDNSPKPTEPE